MIYILVIFYVLLDQEVNVPFMFYVFRLQWFCFGLNNQPIKKETWVEDDWNWFCLLI